MLVVHVSIRVKPESVEPFVAATLENARNSILEPGIARFDFIQEEDDPTRFKLIEVFRTPEAQLAHRETPHYNTWRETVADMMAEPRTFVRYQNRFPEDSRWGLPDVV